MIFVDMDGVLVNQTSRKRFDLMGWMPGGKILWDFVRPHNPTILSQLMSDIYPVSRPEKEAWCARELGAHVPVIVVRAELGKHPHCMPGSILVDDSEAHKAQWIRAGGIFVHHTSAEESIARLSEVLR